MILSQIIETDKKHFMPVYAGRVPLAFEKGEGAKLYDINGREYVDFLAGIAVCSLGYSDRGFKDVVRSQVDKLIHTSNIFYVEQQAKLEESLCSRSGYERVFFANSGAEANECAIKLAKKYAFEKGLESANFVSLKNSFHGRTLATLSATGQEKFHAPFEPGTYSYKYVEAGDAAALEKAVDANTCAVLLEVIQGEGGVYPLPEGFVKKARELCTANDALLVIDEIQTGMGRTGKFLAQEHYGVKADVVTLAKALGNGIPIGACLATEKAASAFKPGDHGTTFGGGLLACAAADYVVRKMDDKLLGEVAKKGDYLWNGLESLRKRSGGAIEQVRGKGLMLGVGLSSAHSASDVRDKMLEKGFILGMAGNNTLRLVPPFVIGRDEIDAMLAALKEVL